MRKYVVVSVNAQICREGRPGGSHRQDVSRTEGPNPEWIRDPRTAAGPGNSKKSGVHGAGGIVTTATTTDGVTSTVDQCGGKLS